MKKVMCGVVLFLAIVIGGCSLGQATPENPLGFNDPNEAVMYFQAGQQFAHGTQAVGLATGNPLLIAGSSLALLVIGAFGAVYLRKESK